MKFMLKTSIVIVTISLILVSCADKDLYKGGKTTDTTDSPTTTTASSYTPYLYPYSSENLNSTVEISIVTDGSVQAANKVNLSIPPLKYNKSWLFMLTQDDCVQAAFCRTWAAINGRPVSNSDSIWLTPNWKILYYDVEQLAADDLPPNVFRLGKPLGSTDGCGNEIRFHATTTLSPEWNFMNASTSVNKGFTDNYYRFFMRSGLRWNNVKEMLNFGTGIAFHDMNTTSTQNADSILKHYPIAQDSILRNLSGRGAKMLAEPNGNKTYVAAANNFPDIQTLTAQSDAVELYPFQTTTDLQKVLLSRYFPSDTTNIAADIQALMQLPKAERKAIHVGVHNMDNKWVNFLLWLNNTYGKDGDDSVWFPSQEEYYEYNYYRIHSTTSTTANGDTLRIRLTMPSGKYFYYPSLTLNLSGIQKANVRSISTNDAITGLSFSNHDDGLTLNIDCRKHLVEHATHYVEAYEKNPTSLSLADARYFVNQLKESTTKEALLKRLK